MNEQDLVRLERPLKEAPVQQEKEELEDQKEMCSEVLLKNIPVMESALNHLKSKKNLSVEDMNEVAEILDSSQRVFESTKRFYDQIEQDHFSKAGQMFDSKKLIAEFKKQKLKKKFPKFQLKRYIELTHDPITSIKNYAGETIRYSKYWVRKNLIAINQMIFNEMDLYILNIGKEGSGKSCWSSQQMLYFYTFLTEVGLIDYAYDIKRMFFVDILSFLNEHDNQGPEDYFRIEVMDEGNDLNRANYRDEMNQQFHYEMRTDRRMLRIVIINMQQIGELNTSISLSRVNFIYDCHMKNKFTTGTLEKGQIKMYIIPRGNTIYSRIKKTEIRRIDILNAFANKLDKKKEYYVDLPTQVAVADLQFTNKWGFNKTEYDKYVKSQMKAHKYQKGISLTATQMYILATKVATGIKYLGTFDLKDKADKKMYENLRYLFKKINKDIALKPEKYKAIRQFMAQN